MTHTTTAPDKAYYDVTSLISVGDFIYTCSPQEKEILETDVSTDGVSLISSRSGVLDSAPREIVEDSGLFYAITDEGLYNFRDKIINAPTKLLFDDIDSVLGVIDGYVIVSAGRFVYLVDQNLSIKASRFIEQRTDVLAVVDNNIYSIRRDGGYVILQWDNTTEELNKIEEGKFQNVKNAKRAVVFIKNDLSDKIMRIVMQNYGITTIDVNDPDAPVFRDTVRYEKPNDVTNLTSIDEETIFVSSDDYLEDFQVTFPINWGRSFAAINARNLVVSHSDVGKLTFTDEYEGLPLIPPQDFISLWDLSAKIVPLNDSWQTLPRETIPDTIGSRTLTVLNDASNGSAQSRIVRFEPSVAAPDGLGGLYAVERHQNLTGDTTERCRLQTAAPVDFNTLGAYSLGCFFNPSGVIGAAGFDLTSTLFSQGTSAANGMRVYAVVSQVAGGLNTAKIEFHTNFGTSGSEMISYTLPGNAKGWRRIRVQQNATTMELSIDGVKVASSSPVGASGINISNGTNFNIAGDTNTSGQTIDWIGGIGQFVDMYSYLLTEEEDLLWYTTAINFDFTTKRTLIDDGVFGTEASNTSLSQWVWGTDRKTAAITLNNSYNLCTTPIYVYSAPVEIQFQSVGAATTWTVGMTSENGSETLYLGQLGDRWGLFWSDQKIYISGSAINAGGAALGDGDVATLRVTPATKTFVWLVNNVVIHSGSFTFDWDGNRGLRFAAGSRSSAPAGSMKLLTNESEFVYPIGSGYTTLDAA